MGKQKTKPKKPKARKEIAYDQPIHKRLYYKYIPFKQKTSLMEIIDPNPYLRSIQFFLDLHMITLQQPAIPTYEKNHCLRLADLFVRTDETKKNGDFKWTELSNWKIPVEKGLKKPLWVKCNWKSMSKFHDVNPPYVKPETKLVLLIEETKLTGNPIGLPKTDFHPGIPYEIKCVCGASYSKQNLPVKQCIKCGRLIG